MTLGPTAVAPTLVPTRRGAVIAWVDRHALFLAGLAACWVALLARVPFRLNQDGWLALVGGREVADHGIPHHDRLGAFTHGVRWIDQQWLAQLGMYGIHQAGGLALVCIVYVGLAVAAMGLAIAAARALGAADLMVLATLPIPGFLFFAASGQIRTQGFAYPLFVVALWLLASDSRAPSRRVYWVFAILILWANLHGSVTLGAGLVVLHGLAMLARDVFREGARPRRPLRLGRALAFIAGGPACLLVTPYGLGIVDYYRDTLFDSQFRSVITEWAPVTSEPILAVPFFAAAFATLWLLGRARRALTLFEQLALLALIVSGITAVRNVTWAGLAFVVLIPVLLTALKMPRPARRRTRVNLALVALMTLVLLSTFVAVATKPRSWFEQGYDQRAAAVVSDAMRRDPSLRVYAGDRFGDWLLWHDPSLAGRIAYDSRLELLTHRQLRQLVDLSNRIGTNFAALIDGYQLRVLDPKRLPKLTHAILSLLGTHIVYRGHDVVIASRPSESGGEN
jgi:hypothetical protein